MLKILKMTNKSCMNFRGGFCGKLVIKIRLSFREKRCSVGDTGVGITCSPFFPCHTGFPCVRQYGV